MILSSNEFRVLYDVSSLAWSQVIKEPLVKEAQRHITWFGYVNDNNKNYLNIKRQYTNFIT